MKVCIISHDLSNNCLGRAHVLAGVLADEAAVEIIGTSATGEIWAPLRHDTSTPIRMLGDARYTVAAEAIGDADVVYAVKPRPTSLGLALTHRRATGTPVVADVDDWELAFFLDNPRWLLRNAIDVRLPNNLWATVRSERSVRRADAVTVSSTWLRGRFGGHVVPHARDESVYDTALDGGEMRRHVGLEGRKVVLFLGSVRAHKGLETVIQALDSLNDDRIALLIVGDAYDLPQRSWIRLLPQQPFHLVPEFLAAADLVVLAQQDSRAARAQVPAKVFDAMAMAKPVVATSVSDLPTILDGCGLIVEPGDSHELAIAIRKLVDDPELADRLGSEGRARFVAEYSFGAVRPRLVTLLESLVRSRTS